MKKMNDESMMMIQSYTQPLNHFLTHSLRVYGTSGVISSIRPAARGLWAQVYPRAQESKAPESTPLDFVM